MTEDTKKYNGLTFEEMIQAEIYEYSKDKDEEETEEINKIFRAGMKYAIEIQKILTIKLLSQ